CFSCRKSEGSARHPSFSRLAATPPPLYSRRPCLCRPVQRQALTSLSVKPGVFSMKRQHRFRRSQLRKPGPWHPVFEPLESRLLLCTSGSLPAQHLGAALGSFPAADGSLAVGEPAPASAGGQGGPTASLTGVPVLNSLPGAAASLYLDFDGHFEAQWGGYSN